MMNLPTEFTTDQLRILRHMLGIDTPNDKTPRPYRDYFCANPGDEHLLALEAAGAVVCYRRDNKPEGYHWYRCTDAGRAAAIKSHRSIRLKKSARVYGKYLDVRDCFPDLTFHQFLTSDQFSELRREA